MSLFHQNQTYYDLLEISKSAAQHEITEAYRRAKATYSPDSPALYSMFSTEEAAELLKLIEEAYITLSNRVSRQEYDQKLLRHQTNSSDAPTDAFPEFNLEEVRSKDSHNSTGAETSATEPLIPNVQEIPEGFAKTKFGAYELNDEFEKEILSGSDFNGAFIQKLRLYKGINLEQMSQETKISRPYLMALESNDYDALPARVFVRGFIVQICKVLGVDGQKIAGSYMEILKSAQN